MQYRWIAFFLFIYSSCFASLNIDSLVEKVYTSYLHLPYTEYSVDIHRYDSSGKKLYSTIRMTAKSRKPDYHFVFNGSVEKIMYKGNYYELHHKDSLIYVLLNAPIDSSLLNSQDILAKFKSYKFIYELESETKTHWKIRMKNPEEIQGFYMSMMIDKKTMKITQNQMNKVELEGNRSKIFLYQMVYTSYIQNEVGNINFSELAKLVADPSLKLHSKFRHYKIEYKND